MSLAASRAERLHTIVSDLTAGTPEVTGAAIVSADGLMIASALAADMNELSIGGMASVLLSLGTRASTELSLEAPQQILIQADTGNALVTRAGRGAVLLVLMSKKAALGLVFLDVSYAAEAIAELV